MSFGPPPSMYTESTRSADIARRRRRTKLLGVVAVIVIAALCVGGWLLSYAGDDKASADSKAAAVPQRPYDIRETVEKAPKSVQGELALDYIEDGYEKDETHLAPGAWATDKYFAQTIATTVVGYKIDNDGKAWTLKLGGHVCATTPHVTVDGRTAVVVQPPKEEGSATEGVCDQVVFFDINTGKKIWQAKIPDANSAFVTNTNITMTSDTVAVAWSHGSVAYEMKHGKQLWKDTGVSTCEDAGFAGGRSLLALVKCGRDAPTYQVHKLDPRTGKTKWTYKLTKGLQQVFLPSSDPPVIAVSAGDISVTDLITLDENGKHLASISTKSERYDPSCGTTNGYFGVVEKCKGLVVGQKQLFIVTKDTSSDLSDWITAFDVTTGKTVRKLDGGFLSPPQPLRMSGDKLLVFRDSGDEVTPSAVLSWDPDTGKSTPLLYFGLPSDVTMPDDPFAMNMVYESGRIFFAPTELSRDSVTEENDDELVWTALGIGSYE